LSNGEDRRPLERIQIGGSEKTWGVKGLPVVGEKRKSDVVEEATTVAGANSEEEKFALEERRGGKPVKLEGGGVGL